MNNFGKKLKKLRIDNGLTQEQLADILNVARMSIFRYENQKAKPRFKTIKKISDYFKVSLEYLIND